MNVRGRTQDEFEEVYVRIALVNGFGDVKGIRIGDHFALTPDEDGDVCIITHLPSGLRIPAHMGRFTLATARVYISRLMSLPINWTDGDWRLINAVKSLTEAQLAMLMAPIQESHS